MNILKLNTNDGLASFSVGTISAINGTVISQLSSDDVDNPTRPGHFSDDYSLVDVTVGEQVSISLTSDLFDTFLQLINADTQEVIDFDDDSGEILNSLLTFVPETGINYIVRVTSFSGGVTGEYTLNATNRSGVDLVVSKIIAPDTALLGSTIDISWTVTNKRTEATTAFFWDDYIYFSTDEFFDFSDTFIASEFIFSNPVAGEDSYTRSRNISLSSFGLEAGEGYLLVVTDNFDSQPETNEDNNVTAIPITLTVPDVDLVVSEIIAPDTALFGSTIDISWTVTNQGSETTTASFWEDDIYFSTDEFFDFSDTFIASEFIFNPVAGGESYTVERSVSLSSSPFSPFLLLPFPGLEAGEGYLLVVTDNFSNSQPETNEDNNVTAVPITLTVPDVDLVVSEIIAPDIALFESTIDISWTVTNQGTEATTASFWEDDIYFSTDEFFDFSDTFLGFESIFNPLARGESYTIDRSINIPTFLAAGDGYLLVITDNFFNSQPETNEDNNVTAIPFNITNFDPAQYGASHSDLIEEFGYDLEAFRQHYFDFGRIEGRSLDNFDEFRYIASHPADLISAFGTNGAAATEHYIRFGFGEGRSLTSFDPAQYLASYDDLTQFYGYNPQGGTEHYIRFGYNEILTGMRPQPSFDPALYLATYSDLIESVNQQFANLSTGSFSDNYDSVLEFGNFHFITFGINEGRSRFGFDPNSYLSLHSDLQAAFGNDLLAATRHYIEFGFEEGRMSI